MIQFSFMLEYFLQQTLMDVNHFTFCGEVKPTVASNSDKQATVTFLGRCVTQRKMMRLRHTPTCNQMLNYR